MVEGQVPPNQFRNNTYHQRQFIGVSWRTRQGCQAGADLVVTVTTPNWQHCDVPELVGLVLPLLSHCRVEIYTEQRFHIHPNLYFILKLRHWKSYFYISVYKQATVTFVLTQQVRVQGQHWSQVRGGLGDDEADQVGVEAGQSVERPRHHSTHGVTDHHHTLRRRLQVLQGGETEGKEIVKPFCSIVSISMSLFLSLLCLILKWISSCKLSNIIGALSVVSCCFYCWQKAALIPLETSSLVVFETAYLTVLIHVMYWQLSLQADRRISIK